MPEEITYENHLRDQLGLMQRDFEKAAEPILRELARIEAVRLPVAFVMPSSALAPAVLEILGAPEIPTGGELAQANALLEHAMDHAGKHGSEGYASGKAAELLALFARALSERDALSPDAARFRQLVHVMDPACVVPLFESGYEPHEIVTLIDAAMPQGKV